VNVAGSSAARRARISTINATADELNEAAWSLATSPENSERDGRQAVIYAKKACEISKMGDAHFLSTLAAAYAEAGQFEAALRYAREALAMEKRVSGIGPANFRQRAQMETFVELFMQKKPYRDDPR
jgi:tetratricopeptide (TPR) repeat protein